MEKERFQLVGMPTYSRAGLHELNELVSEIINLCGIRWYEERILSDGTQEIPVTSVAVPDENGIIHFNYSVFEKKLREPSWFNTRTGELHTEDHGYAEFGVAMVLISVAQECYSETPCCLIDKNLPCNLYGYCVLIQTMTGKKVRNIWRERPVGLMAALSKTYSFINYNFAQELFDEICCSHGYIIWNEAVKREYTEICSVKEADQTYFEQLKNRNISYVTDGKKVQGVDSCIHWYKVICRESGWDCLVIPEWFRRRNELSIPVENKALMTEVRNDVADNVKYAQPYQGAVTTRIFELLCSYFGVDSIDERLIRILREETASPIMQSAVYTLKRYVEADVNELPELPEEHVYRYITQHYCSKTRKMKIYLLLCMILDQELINEISERKGA